MSLTKVNLWIKTKTKFFLKIFFTQIGIFRHSDDKNKLSSNVSFDLTYLAGLESK